MALAEEKFGLPHDVLGAHDAIRHGLPGLKSDVISSFHPVEIIQKSRHKLQEETKRTLLQRAYGSAFPLKMDIEQQILSRVQRPGPFIPSSKLGLESLTGILDELEFGDLHYDVQESEHFVPCDVHHAMEVRLGLSKGPAPRSIMCPRH